MSTVAEGSGDITNNNQEDNSNNPLEWQKEQEKLMVMISNFESKLSETTLRLTTLEGDLQSCTNERDALRTKVTELESQLAESKKQQQLYTTDSQVVETMKEKSEDMLTRAKGIIFEKMKMCKNQELQIEALNQQVASLKEVVAITKDLLEIRNIEVSHLQDKLGGMEQKIDSEKERYSLMHSKLDKMIQMNSDLKREYETQLCLFTALRERYNERELAKNVLENLRHPTSDGTECDNDTTTTANDAPN